MTEYISSDFHILKLISEQGCLNQNTPGSLSPELNISINTDKFNFFMKKI